MTEKQAIRRWRLRHDYLEDRLATMISVVDKIPKEDAIELIRHDCECVMKAQGLKYPFKETDL